MEEYIVSARKYRPANFDTVVGQRALTTTLLNAIRTGKLAHAYLFCGPRGVGKTTCARIFAKTINCLNPTAEGEACNECESCRAFEEQRSMNIHELDAASNNSVDDIRELIEQVRIPPQMGKYKVFIIDEVHMLSSQAFNAFLKTLEEPPSYVIFILATTEKHKILPTILSRCQVYDFARMTIQNTVDHLAYVAQKEGYTAEPEALNLIAQKADGGMRDALSIFDQMVSFTGGNITYESTLENLNVLNTEYYFRLVDHFLKCEVQPCMLLFNEVLNKGFDGGNFIAGLASHMRNLLVARDAQTLPLLEVSESVRGKFQEQAQKCAPTFLYKAIKLCNDCDVNYRQSKNKRLQVELCLIQAAQLNQDDSVGSGRQPEQTLKPIFQQPVDQATTTAAPQPASPKPAVQTHVEPTMEPKTPKAPAPQPVPAQKKVVAAPTATPASNASPLSLNSVSINQRQKANVVQQQTVSAEKIGVSDQGSLTASNLLQCWQRLAQNMESKSEIATAQRMRGITPTIVSADTFKIVVSSEMVKQTFQSLQQNIEQYILQQTEAPSVHMQIDIEEAQVAQKRYSKPEMLKGMKTQTPSVERLVQGLKLEID